jgi:hypothetical protein
LKESFHLKNHRTCPKDGEHLIASALAVSVIASLAISPAAEREAAVAEEQ